MFSIFSLSNSELTMPFFCKLVLLDLPTGTGRSEIRGQHDCRGEVGY